MAFDPNPFTDHIGRTTYADMIAEVLNGDDDIDKMYLLDAIENDLRLGTMRHLMELLKNPIS